MVVKDWHEDLIRAAEYREMSSIRRGRRDQTAWGKALQLLRANKKKIFRVKSGPNKDTVKGLPQNLNPQVSQILIRVVMEEEPIILNEDISEPEIEERNVFRNRKWGDSITSLLAAMYVQLRKFPTIMSKRQICAIAARYCNHAIEDDYRNRKRGAWTSMNHDLIQKYSFVESRRAGMGNYMSPMEYYLTQAGIAFSYALFTRKFHPRLGTCREVIASPYATVHEDGTVVAHVGAADARLPGDDLDDADFRAPAIESEDEGLGWGENAIAPSIRNLGRDLFQNHSARIPEEEFPIDDGARLMDPQDLDMVRAIRISRFEQQQKQQHSRKIKQQITVPVPKVEVKIDPHEGNILPKYLDEDEQLSLAIAQSLQQSICSTPSQKDLLNQFKPPPVTSQQSTPLVVKSKRHREEIPVETPHRKESMSVKEPLSTPIISLVDDDSPKASENRRKRRRTGVDTSTTSKQQTNVITEVDGVDDDIYFDLSGVVEYEQQKYRPAEFSVTTDPSSGCVLDLSFSQDDPDEDTKSVSSDSSIASQSNSRGIALPQQSRKFSSSTLSSVSLLQNTTPIEIDLTASSATQSLQYPPRGKMNPSRKDLACTVFVDRRERKDQANYRMFFLGIEKHFKELFSEHTLIEQCLPLGDFLFMKASNRLGLNDANKKDPSVRVNHVIERKTVNDIISRSLGDKKKFWAFEGAHVRQIRHLQYCGIESSFILLEGPITGLIPTAGPLVRYTGQTGPDMITSSFDIMVFVTNMIAGGWGKYRPHLLQSNDEVRTALLLAAISYLFMQNPTSCSYGEVNWGVKKEELSLSLEFDSNDIDREFGAVVIRKFSNRNALREAYEIAKSSSEEHARFLLADLHPNVSLSGRQTILSSSSYDDDSEEEESELKPSMNPQRESEKIMRLILQDESSSSSELARKNTSATFSERRTTIVMNNSMKAILNLSNNEEDGGSTTFPDSIQIEIQKEEEPDALASTQSSRRKNSLEKEIGDCSWAVVTVKAESINLHRQIVRQAAPVYVYTLDGDAIMEALIQSEEIISSSSDSSLSSLSTNQLFDHFYSVIEMAVNTFLQSLLPHPLTPTGHLSVTVLLLNNFNPMGSNSGSYHRLQNELNKIQFNTSSEDHQATIKLKKDRMEVNVEAAKVIRLYFLKIISPLLVAYLNIQKRCYVIESKSSKECEKWLSFLFTSIHIHSLLLY